MCNASCIAFGAKYLSEFEVRNKRVLEVGAIDINGNLRPVVTAFGPKEYIGVDIEPGKGVDVVCRAEEILERFGKESFDVIITTEMLEHVRDWRLVVSNLKLICRPGGLILLTTRSRGFKYHGFPYDFWRFEIADMQAIFSDLEILALEPDPDVPGVMLKARKPEGEGFAEKDLSGIALYSVVTNSFVLDVKDGDFHSFYFTWIKFRTKLREWRHAVKRVVGAT